MAAGRSAQERAGDRAVLWASIGSAPAVVFVGLFVAGGLFSLFLVSFWQVRNFDIEALWTLDNYLVVGTDYLGVVTWTLFVAGVVSVLTVVLAVPFAYVATFKAGARREVLVLLILITIFSGYLVKVYAMKTILGSDGLINSLLRAFGLIQEPLPFLIYSPPAVILALTNTLVPLAVLPIFSALQNVPYSLVEASKDLGAGRWRTFLNVTLPLGRTGIVTAFAIAFILSAGDFVTPALLGGPSGLMVGQVVASRFGVAFDWPVGSALAFVTVALALLVIGLVNWLSRLVLDRQ